MNASTASSYRESTSNRPNSIYNFTTQTDWIVPVAVNLVLMFLTLWILFALVHYGVKTKKWTRRRASHLDMLSIGMVYTSAVACAGVCMMLLIINFAYLNVGFSPVIERSLTCEVIADTAVALYGVLLFLVALFLWFRQRVFYQNKMLNMDYNKCVHVLSSISIIMVLVGAIAALVINILPLNRHSSRNGCIFTVGDQRIFHFLSVVIVIVLGQLMLAALFAYALIKTNSLINPTPMRKLSHNPSRNRDSIPNSTDYTLVVSGMSTQEQSTSQSLRYQENNTTQSKGVRIILQKTLTFAILSTAADIFIQTLIHFLTEPTGHRRIVTTASNVNAFSNLVFLLLSFAQYKKILLSPFQKRVCKK